MFKVMQLLKRATNTPAHQLIICKHRDTILPFANLIKLRNGHLLLVFNDNNEGRRMPLTVAISTDNDKSYPYRRDIAGGDNSFAYPYAIQTRDGKIHIVYTTNGRTTIMHAVFDEYAVIGSPPEL